MIDVQEEKEEEFVYIRFSPVRCRLCERERMCACVCVRACVCVCVC